ncbi:MAG: hypothetical protein HKN24_11375 [Acidimicrobiales bacterium]|nr:hypothetical protein [Acidimicrobiales bacterium]
MRTTISRRRSGTVRVLAVLGLLTFGLSVVIVLLEVSAPVADESNLETAGSPEAQMGANHPGETVHVGGALAVLLIGSSGLIGLVVHPRRLGSARQTVGAMASSVVVMGIVGDPDNHGGQAGPFDVAMLLFAVPALAAGLLAAPPQTWRRARIEHPRFLALAVAGIPLLFFAVNQALVQRNTWPPLADPHHQAHWYTMGVLGFMVVICIAVASFGGQGWQVASASAGLGALAIGMTSLFAPEAASAQGWPWALAAVGWGLVVLLVNATEGEEPDNSPPRSSAGQRAEQVDANSLAPGVHPIEFPTREFQASDAQLAP